MITKESTLSFPPSVTEDRDVLYFDIETTGLNPRDAGLYMIGCCHCDGGGWRLLQWFAEGLQDEAKLLEAFFSYLKPFRKLVHYNGTGFDLPFLTACIRQYRLPYHFRDVESVDLFHMTRHLHRIFCLPSYRQKDVEAFFSFSREDKKSGGELIEQYLRYCEAPQPDLLAELLLHNSDDVSNLPLIHHALLNYRDLYQARYSLTRLESEEGLSLLLSFYDRFFPRKHRLEIDRFSLTFSENRVEILLPFFRGELRHFYPNYREYYYLPEEDMALHQKIAQFVDKTHRKKATASTCYTRSSGLFLEQPAALLEPDFVEEYRGKRHFIPYHPDSIKEEELRLVCDHLLSGLYPSKKGSDHCSQSNR